MLKSLTTENFQEEISQGLVLVDFFATWCGPCKMMHPVLEELSNEIDSKIIMVDVDQFENLAREYAVMSVPTLILFKDGQITQKNIGYTPKEVLLTWFK